MRRRNFTVGEANALLPHLREILAQIQELRGVVGDRTDKLKILDVIWGRQVQDSENPDHQEFDGHRKAIGGAVGEIERLIREEILALGVRFPPGAWTTVSWISQPDWMADGCIFAGAWVRMNWRPGTRWPTGSEEGNP